MSKEMQHFASTISLVATISNFGRHTYRLQLPQTDITYEKMTSPKASRH